MKIRLIRGPDDSEGKPIVFVINLLSKRKYARVSMQPIKSWNLKKSAKIRAFQEQKEA